MLNSLWLFVRINRIINLTRISRLTIHFNGTNFLLSFLGIANNIQFATHSKIADFRNQILGQHHIASSQITMHNAFQTQMQHSLTKKRIEIAIESKLSK